MTDSPKKAAVLELPSDSPSAESEAASPAEGAPEAEPLTDIQRRAMLAEKDIIEPPPADEDQDKYLSRMALEVQALMGPEGLHELERTRDNLSQEAEVHKVKRDKLNTRTKELAMKRDRLNSEVAIRVQEAQEHREKRNTLNEEVKAAKVMRDQLNQKANELAEAAAKLKRERHRDVATPVPRLKEELRALEFRHQTTPLTPDKEKALVAEMKRLEREIRKAEALMESDKEVHEAVEAARTSKVEAETQHQKLSEMARQAQAEHDSMMGLYEEADAMRKEADDAQAEFLANKRSADEEHHRHIEQIKKVRDFDKIISGIRRRQREVRRAEAERKQEMKTDSVMEKFKKGEKLSTEDLLALQMRGE